MDVLLEGGPRHQHHVRLPEPLPDVLVEDDGEYVRLGDAGAYAWVPYGGPARRWCVACDMPVSVCEQEHSSDSNVEHIRPVAPPARTHAPEQGMQ